MSSRLKAKLGMQKSNLQQKTSGCLSQTAWALVIMLHASKKLIDSVRSCLNCNVLMQVVAASNLKAGQEIFNTYGECYRMSVATYA